MKQSSLDENEQLGMELEAQNAENMEDISDLQYYGRQFDDPMNGERNGEMQEAELNKQNSVSNAQPPEPEKHPTLPWAPKVRTKDIYQFMDISRRKFIGYSLPNENCETTAGLPKPICEGIKILKRVSLQMLLNQESFITFTHFLAPVHKPC